MLTFVAIVLRGLTLDALKNINARLRQLSARLVSESM